MRYGLAALAALSLASCGTTDDPGPGSENWTPLFNGENLDGWVPKVAHHPLGENVNDVFRVEDGILRVTYEDFESWGGEFGHLFYETPFAHYRLRLEYRFVGPPIPGAPDWTTHNSGVMLHAQPPETMGLDQDFPISIENQFVGAGASVSDFTGNLCTPESSIIMQGVRNHTHCIDSIAPAQPLGDWVHVEVEVDGDRIVRHLINDVEAISYEAPTTDEPQDWAPDQRLVSGYIALQAEAQPVEFRNVEILNLE